MSTISKSKSYLNASDAGQGTVPTVERTFRGMMPILPTTIHPGGELDLVSQNQLVRHALACNAVSIGHIGAASEHFKLTASDRSALIENLLSTVNKRVPVFIGVTGPSTRNAVEFARQAEALGADLLMLATPYLTVPDLEGTRAYIHEVCAAVSIPVILQDTAVSDRILTPEVTIQLFSEIPNLRYFKADGLKFLEKSSRLLELTNNEIEIIGGLGGRHMIHMLRMGITSFMTGTEALDIHANCVHAYLEGDHAKSEDVFYRQIMPYFDFYRDYSDELLKRMLHWRGIIQHPNVIPPEATSRMSQAEWDAFEGILKQLEWRTDWSDILEVNAAGTCHCSA